MYLEVDTASGHTVVCATDDLQHLSVRIDHAADQEAVARAVGPLARLEGTDHAWIDIQALRSASGREADATWLSGFEKMISYATAQGWVDEAGTAVRAHIEHDADADT
jgi:hypothetical protein